MQQRKGVWDARAAASPVQGSAMEEGHGVVMAGPSGAAPYPGHPPNPTYVTDEEWRSKRGGREPRAQGWSPTVVLMCGAILLSLCFGWYMAEQFHEAKMTLSTLTVAYQDKQTEHAQALAMQKRRLEETEKGLDMAKKSEFKLTSESKALHESVTTLQHDLHEEQARSRRMKRDIDDLHKKLKVKSEELRVLDEQATLFNKEMSAMTKTLHTLHGETEIEADSSDDYSTLYKKQEAQQQRLHENLAVRAKQRDMPPGANHRKGGGGKGGLGVALGGGGGGKEQGKTVAVDAADTVEDEEDAHVRLLVLPGGDGAIDRDRHLSVSLQLMDDMWMPTASATIKLVNVAPGLSRSIAVPAARYGTSRNAWQGHTFFELATLNTTPGFLVDDTLVLTVDIEVQREARFALDPGCVPSDLMLKLPSGPEVSTHWHTLRMGSDVLCGSPESASLSYGFTKLLTKLGDFVKGQTLLSNPQHPSNSFTSWLMLAERLQLDDLSEQLVNKLCKMPDDELANALVKPNDNPAVTVLRGEVQELSSDTRNCMLTLILSRLLVVTSRTRVAERGNKRLRDDVGHATASASAQLNTLRARGEEWADAVYDTDIDDTICDLMSMSRPDDEYEWIIWA
ncbi:hypothetical protein FOA52_015434 [Chlamydomonas sp. UWO 241]|nr:hypothetical protein FOA52_015434 [Chlamydomonas sp. UWO 241]